MVTTLDVTILSFIFRFCATLFLRNFPLFGAFPTTAFSVLIYSWCVRIAVTSGTRNLLFISFFPLFLVLILFPISFFVLLFPCAKLVSKKKQQQKSRGINGTSTGFPQDGTRFPLRFHFGGDVSSGSFLEGLSSHTPLQNGGKLPVKTKQLLVFI